MTQASPSRNFRDILDTRFSCRAYLSKEVDHESIECILSIAQRTPSWCNSQPWQVLITEASATDRLRAAMEVGPFLDESHWEISPPTEYAGIYRERRRTCGWQLYESVGVAPGDREASAKQAAENFRFFGAPHIAIITTEPLLGPYGVLDCGAYINNFMLAAASLGIAAIAQAAIASKAQVLRQHLPIADSRQIVCGISFGFPDTQHAANGFRTDRAPVSDVATFITA